MTGHGGNIYEIERLYNIKKNNIIDFSSNINPLGLSDKIKNIIIKSINIVSQYPDPDYFKLKKSIAYYYGIDFNDIIVGNGGTELIFSIINSLKPKKSLIVSPTFSEYEKALKVNLLKFDYFRLEEKNDFYPDFKKLKSILRKKYDCVFICNPNNPTGTFLNLEEMEKIIHECNTHKSMIFIDESFIDFTGSCKNDSAMNILPNYNNAIILHSLTKFFAIPGLRLGFAVTSNKKLKKVIDIKNPPWSVNTLSEIAGINMFNDKKYIEKTNRAINLEKKYLYKNLIKLKCLKVFKSSANFILIKLLNEITSQKLKGKLIAHKLLIRDASNFKFLNDKFIRIAIKNRNDNKILIKKMNEIF